MKSSNNVKICPNCGSSSWVYDTRVNVNGYLMRRRKCKRCKLVWKTMEVFVEEFDDKSREH